MSRFYTEDSGIRGSHQFGGIIALGFAHPAVGCELEGIIALGFAHPAV
jgi:hypothetical protein